MSIFSIPETLMPDMSKIEAMNREFAALLPYGGKDNSAVSLTMHPAGSAAAMSALSMGVASHAFGVWMGAVAGSMEATRQLCGMKMPGMEIFGFGATWDDSDCDVDAARPEPKSPVSRAKSAAKTLMADLESASADFAGAADKVTSIAGKPTGAKPFVKEVKAPAAPVHVADEVSAESASKILPEDFRRPGAIDRPEKPDDLKLVSGVGPKLEQVLNGLGVWTFAQIAGWTVEEIAWVDDYLAFAGRIERDGWLKQAAALAEKAG
ncbi:MAG: NADH-ubiquinone dehydrogenase [Hyphomicrobiales bacterium]|nr:NADH-ubiquinone dehydrogenase [Hyphomicrobiales bacterium]